MYRNYINEKEMLSDIAICSPNCVQMWKGFSSCQGLPLKKRSNNPAPPSLTMKIMKHIFSTFFKKLYNALPKICHKCYFSLRENIENKIR